MLRVCALLFFTSCARVAWAAAAVPKLDWDTLKLLPKVDLHCHLECGVKYETLIDEYDRQGMPLPVMNKKDLQNYLVVKEPVKDFDTYLKIMERHQVIFGDPRAITRVAKELVITRADENTKIFELRYSPVYLARNNGRKLTLETVHEAVKRGIEEGIAAAEEKGIDIRVYLVCSDHVIFGHSPWDLDGLAESVHFALQHRQDFVGFDVACFDTDMTPYSPYLDRIDSVGLGITVHAESVSEPAKIRFMVDSLHAQRIGHGLHVPENDEIFRYLKEKQIHFEEAPIANVRAAEISDVTKHPINKYLREGYSVSINSDDPGLLNITLTEEYVFLQKIFNWTLHDFFTFNRHAVKNSFAPADVRKQMLEKFFSAEKEKEFVDSVKIVR